PTADEMLVRMAGLCAAAEQCASDIRNKILKQGFSADQTENIVEYLKKNKYLDDNRYARAYAVDKVRFSGWGRMKVRMGLRAKGMGDGVISQALEYIPVSDYDEALSKVMAAKAKNLDLKDVKDRQKLYHHLSSRGFESNLIVSAMRRMVKESQER
ncbi:MAG: RecX family transcriptional regulator, partial [Muribaculaceae bacterium]|nr:RecX family transcriptional regulator [Muribaculaceae bacterium]